MSSNPSVLRASKMLPFALLLLLQSCCVSMAAGRVAFEKMTEYDFVGTTYYTIQNLSLWECQGWCQEEPECAAASYSFVSNPLAPVQETLCLLQNETMAANPSAKPARAVSLYYMTKLTVRSDNVCNRRWQFERVPNRELRGRDNARMHANSKEDCLSACLNERRFVCRSAEYNYLTLQCHLSEFDRRTVGGGVALQEAQDSDYFENLCLDDSNACRSATRGYSEATLGMSSGQAARFVQTHYYVDKELMASTVLGCEKACKDETEFLCRSFLFKGPLNPANKIYNCQLFHLDHLTFPDGRSTFSSLDRPLLDDGKRTGKYYENTCGRSVDLTDSTNGQLTVDKGSASSTDGLNSGISGLLTSSGSSSSGSSSTISGISDNNGLTGSSNSGGLSTGASGSYGGGLVTGSVGISSSNQNAGNGISASGTLKPGPITGSFEISSGSGSSSGGTSNGITNFGSNTGTSGSQSGTINIFGQTSVAGSNAQSVSSSSNSASSSTNSVSLANSSSSSSQSSSSNSNFQSSSSNSNSQSSSSTSNSQSGSISSGYLSGTSSSSLGSQSITNNGQVSGSLDGKITSNVNTGSSLGTQGNFVSTNIMTGLTKPDSDKNDRPYTSDNSFGGSSGGDTSSSVVTSRPDLDTGSASGGLSSDVNCDPTGVCYDVSVHCKDTRIAVEVGTNKPFNGRIYALGRSETCNIAVINSDRFRLDLTMGGQDCNTQSANGVYTNTVVIQHHSVVMTKTDKIYKIRCTYDMSPKNITFGMMPIRKDAIEDGATNRLTIRDPDMIPITSAPEAPPPRIRILDALQREVETVRIGDRLTFRIEIPESTPYGIFARSCVAMAKDSRSTFKIIDDNGCPVEPAIFPQFVKSGSALQSMYDAFRFTESYGVIFQCNVKYCLGACEPARCQHGRDTVDSYGRKRRSVDAVVESVRSGRSVAAYLGRGHVQETTKEAAIAALAAKAVEEGGEDEEMSISQEILVLDLTEELAEDSAEEGGVMKDGLRQNATYRYTPPTRAVPSPLDTCPTRSSVLALAATCAVLLLTYLLTALYLVMRQWLTPSRKSMR